MKTAFACVLFLVVAAMASASIDAGPDIEALARRADRVVVGKVARIDSHFDVNDFGDQLIFSEVTLDVEETVKGAQESWVVVEVEGGSVGDVTMSVSDTPMLQVDERALFFLAKGKGNVFTPSDRGNGIARIARDGRLEGSGRSLGEVIRAARAASGQ